jgi:hypothetical protein
VADAALEDAVLGRAVASGLSRFESEPHRPGTRVVSLSVTRTEGSWRTEIGYARRVGELRDEATTDGWATSRTLYEFSELALARDACLAALWPVITGESSDGRPLRLAVARCLSRFREKFPSETVLAIRTQMTCDAVDARIEYYPRDGFWAEDGVLIPLSELTS